MPIQLKEHLTLSPYFVDTDKSPGFNWEKYQTKVDQLPDNLFGVLADDMTSEFVKSLTQKYVPLSVQGPDVARLIRDVVIADVFLGDMPQEVQRRLGVDPATAREVASLVVSQVFAPVLEELKQVHRARFPNRIAQQPIQQQPTQPPPIQTLKPKPSYPGEELPESGGNIIDLRSK